MKWLGYLWSGLNTVVSALYLGLFWALGWVRRVGWTEYAVLLDVVPGSALDRYMARGNWLGWASGAFVTVRLAAAAADRQAARTIRHEDRHVQQQLAFGPLQPILYVLASVWIWLFQRSRHSYLDNPFERDARRYAGQVVDIPREWWADPNDRWSWW